MKIRRLVPLTVLVSFIFLALSGLALFFSPQGRVAYWAGWRLPGLSKDQYIAVHTTFMVLFLVLSVWHIVLNWRAIVGYLKDRSRRIRLTRPELLTSVGLCLLLFLAALGGVPPAGTLTAAGESMKAHWEANCGSPPLGSRGGELPGRLLPADGLLPERDGRRSDDRPGGGRGRPGNRRPDGGGSIREPPGDRPGLALEEALGLLRGRGIDVDPDGRLGQEAARHGLTPGELIRMLTEPRSGP